MRVVLATGNAGKIREFAELLGPLGFEFLPQSQFGIEPPEETGDTFEANAILKERGAWFLYSTAVGSKNALLQWSTSTRAQVS